ncbi:MAG TPA: putative porin [Spongiibacteraceae bacterium]
MAAALLAVQCAHADDNAALSDVTAQDLLKLLIDEGVIDKEKLKTLTEKIKSRQKAANAGPVETVSAENKDRKPAAEGNVVRVPYVPQYIKDEIRDQVRMGLKEDVSRDVLAQAKTERWGLPGVVPDWVERIKFYGDVRLREESTLYANGNVQGDYIDVAALNRGILLSGAPEDVFLNTTEDRHRLRARMRLGVKAKVNDQIEAGARLVTGSQNDPVSTNQTLGTNEQKWQTTFDLAYLKYSSRDKGIQAAGGRIENPFYNTDLVWDNDLTFEGVAGTWWPLRSEDIDEDFRAFDPFVRAGAFPLQEIDRSSQDKWLFGAQTGFQYDWTNQSKLTVALAYYSYDNIVGRKNNPGETTFNYTALQTWQRGNTLYDIHTDLDTTDSGKRLYAHAADYKLADFFIEYDIANFAPIHVMLTGDYVKNIGYDKNAVNRRLGLVLPGTVEYKARDKGYQFKAAVGWPTISKARDWQMAFIYRYLERDAVLAEFTDSDFHGGGTDAKGYTLKFDYGIADNTWVTLRWMSSDEIDGSTYPDTSALGTGKLGIDTLQVDINAKF